MNMNRELLPIISSLLHQTSERGSAGLLFLVIDRSGSMEPRTEAVIELVNGVVGQAQRAPGAENGFLSVITFADEVTIDRRPTPLAAVGLCEGYNPDGSTALYAAVDDTLGLALSFLDAVDRVGSGAPVVTCSVVVLSDGGDNMSLDRQYSVQQKAAIARARGFVLRAIGIGISHYELSLALGFDVRHGVTVQPTQAGMDEATTMVSRTFSHTLSGTVIGVDGHTFRGPSK